MQRRDQYGWRRFVNVRMAFALTFTLTLGWFSGTGQARAADPDASQRLKAHLRAGEFGPARDLAAAAAPAERDRWLGEVARAQAAAGVQRGWLQTASSIGDDRVRSGILDTIASQPIGGARGGGTQADFESLIELITTTTEPDTWDTVGGPGAIKEFAGGVAVDSSGLLKKLDFEDGGRALQQLRARSAQRSLNTDAGRPSTLRKVSLNRLEKQLQLRRASGLPVTEEMQVLAGLQKIEYVLVYPDSGDVVLAGPAGPWQIGPEGRYVSAEHGAAVLHLDDFVVVLRNALSEQGRFGCSIRPRQEALARTKAFLAESGKKPLSVGGRDRWLDELRGQLGTQDIEVYGIDPRTRAARVLVEADYHMKLIGMGLEEGTLGVTSYLDSIELAAGQAPPDMNVLRWWFTLNYQALLAAPDRNAFALRGPGVKVLSENELLTEQGERVHTGRSDELNRQFALSFTRNFEALATKYPVYAELRNVFDLALVAGLIVSEDLPGQVGWHMTYFGTPDQYSGRRYEVQLGTAPREVETVMNYRVVNRRHVIAGISGGVTVNTRSLLQPQAMETDKYGLLDAEHAGGIPKQLPSDAWWWD